MQEPALKKSSAPDPSNPCLKKSHKMTFLQLSNDPYAVSIYCLTAGSFTHNGSNLSKTKTIGFKMRGTWLYLSINLKSIRKSFGGFVLFTTKRVHQRIGHGLVTQMDHRGADPSVVGTLHLHSMQDFVDRLSNRRRVLNSI